MRKIMKKTFILFLLLGLACSANAQVTTQNYIRSRKMLNNTGTSYVDNIAYYDGLGRPFQTVTKSTQTGTVKERLATLQEYDAMGRETNAWLPTPVTADYVVAATLKSTAQGSTGYGDTRPYNETVYEASPLNRLLRFNRKVSGSAEKVDQRADNTQQQKQKCQLQTPGQRLQTGVITSAAVKLPGNHAFVFIHDSNSPAYFAPGRAAAPGLSKSNGGTAVSRTTVVRPFITLRKASSLRRNAANSGCFSNSL